MTGYALQIGWKDVPHLTEQQKAEYLAAIHPSQRDARTRGIPVLGAGLIYPVPEAVVVCDPFQLPGYWPRAYAMDVGWNRTAALWGSWDRESDTVYLYSEHYVGQAPPAVHAESIRARGAWMAGAIDPASSGANQKDGSRLIDEYRALGLTLHEADNAVEAGIMACYQRLSAGRLKIFSTLRNTIAEFRIYRRDEHGKVVKENDHLMDCMRYLVMTGMIYAASDPGEMEEYDGRTLQHGRSAVTGY